MDSNLSRFIILHNSGIIFAVEISALNFVRFLFNLNGPMMTTL